MACPPEDSNGLEGMGNRSYQSFLDSVLAAKNSTSLRKYRKLCAEASTGLNYKGRSAAVSPSALPLLSLLHAALNMPVAQDIHRAVFDA